MPNIDLSFVEDETLRSQIQAAIESGTSGMFTQQELDRRVNEAVQKQIKSQAQLEKEIREKIEKDATLTAEQKANKILEEANLAKAEAMKIKNRVTALDKCVAAGISKEDAESMLDYFVTDVEETTVANVDKFIAQYGKMKSTVEKQLAGGTPKPKAGGNETMTKDEFNKLSYAEQVKFKQEHPNEAAAFMAQPNSGTGIMGFSFSE